LRTAASALFLTAAVVTALHAIGERAADPRSSAPLIDRGLAAESDHDFAAAEHDLLDAAHLDRQYLPAWTLANFYFRQHDADNFWLWARRAAALAYDDLMPLSQLSDLLDPGRALAHLPDSPKLEHAYLDFLIRANRFDDAMPIARQLLHRRDATDAPRLRAFTTRLIDAKRATDAVEIWNGIDGTTAGAAFSGEGFDWRLLPSPGLSTVLRGETVDLYLDGHQHEAIPLFERMIAAGSRAQRIKFEYSVDFPGLRWAVVSDGDSQESPPLAPCTWHAFEWKFPENRAKFARLVLFYRREPGTPRADGRLQIRKIHVI
jgi:hypothetical protein